MALSPDMAYGAQPNTGSGALVCDVGKFPKLWRAYKWAYVSRDLMAFALGQIVTLAEDNSKWIILRLLSDELVILQNVDNSDDLIDVLLPELLQRKQGTS